MITLRIQAIYFGMMLAALLAVAACMCTFARCKRQDNRYIPFDATATPGPEPTPLAPAHLRF